MCHFKNFSSGSMAVLALMSVTAMANADPVVKLTGKGSVEQVDDGPSRFVLQGNASHLGKFDCFGEVEFTPGEIAGTWEGNGVAVLRAANGDLLVGKVTWKVDAQGIGQIAFSWRDFVEFSDETIFSNTGRFIRSRPAGAVSRLKANGISDGTSNIIAILIG